MGRAKPAAGPSVRARRPAVGAALALLAWLLWPLAVAEPLWSQTGQPRPQENYTGRNAYTPFGKRLTSAMVREELERRLARDPGNEASIWNVGYDFYRNFPQNQDTAQAIKNGFLSARGGTDEQRLTLRKAAIYWEKIHDYGVGNVPVGQDLNTRDQMYYGDRSKFTTLPRRAPGSEHPGYPRHDWPGRFINKREPYEGRPDNPYPGKYHPGVYP